jgi:tetratricopeptide (TPR) repeat protein
MELALLALLLIPYLLLKYLLSDHETSVEKDLKRYEEGIELFQLNEHPRAIRYFDERLRLYPKSATPYFYRGKCNFQRGNYYAALHDFSQAISYDNTYSLFYLEKGRAHLELGDYNLAFKEFDKAVWHSHNSNPDALRWRGKCRTFLHQHNEAINDFNLAIELGDEEAPYLMRQLLPKG